ncbi:hypothetical protein ABZP36_016407 [Zizania latifolia]
MFARPEHMSELTEARDRDMVESCTHNFTILTRDGSLCDRLCIGTSCMYGSVHEMARFNHKTRGGKLSILWRSVKIFIGEMSFQHDGHPRNKNPNSVTYISWGFVHGRWFCNATGILLYSIKVEGY